MRMRSQLEIASRQRKSNFGHTEIMTFLDGVADNKRVLRSSFGTDGTNKKKTEVWDWIASRVSEVGKKTDQICQVD